MKERIVVDVQEYCKQCKKQSCRTKYCWLKRKKDEGRFEQVPEKFEDLKELCKSIKGNKKDLGGAMWFEFPVPKDSKLWLGKFLCIDEKGQIGIAEKTFGNDISITIFADSLTPARQWQIIKNFIGEE